MANGLKFPSRKNRRKTAAMQFSAYFKLNSQDYYLEKIGSRDLIKKELFTPHSSKRQAAPFPPPLTVQIVFPKTLFINFFHFQGFCVGFNVRRILRYAL